MSYDPVSEFSSTPEPSPMPGPSIPPGGGYAPQPLSPADERTWAMLAHLSVLLNLVTGFLGVGAALLIYIIYKDRSRYIRYQAFQAFLFQLILWAGGGMLIGLVWSITGILSAILIGLLLIPVALILTVVFLVFPIIAVIYGIIGAIETSQGADFRYWIIGDWVAGIVR